LVGSHNILKDIENVFYLFTGSAPTSPIHKGWKSFILFNNYCCRKNSRSLEL